MKSLIAKGVYEEPEWLSDGQSALAVHIAMAEMSVHRGKGPDTQYSANRAYSQTFH